MRYKEYKEIKDLSRLGMGLMRLPVLDGDYGRIDYEKAKAIIDRCMKNGINYYDTAYIYHNGKSEEFAGKALAGYPRESYYIADKFNFQAEPDYEKQFEEQLRRLQMDYIDFYLLHGIQDNFQDDILSSGCIDYFDEQKKNGRIHYLGFSFHGNPENLRKMLDQYPWDFVQIQLNYYDWYFGHAKELYEILETAQIPVMVMEPVHGGLLANLTDDAAAVLKEYSPDASQASWAMRWVMGLPGVQVVLSGMSDTVQAEDNLTTFDQAIPLSDEEQHLIYQAATIQRKAVAVPCSSCRYCCADCPAGLDIPELLKYYNDYKLGGAWRLAGISAMPEEKRPTACIGCGSCTRHCPQGLETPKYMEELKNVLNEMTR